MPISTVRDIARLTLPAIAPKHRFKSQKAPIARDDFDFAGEETQHATHALHPYVAAINPPLARDLISHYVPKGSPVLDPFCGGGGVLVEALMLGRPATGVDVNPLAAAISRAKTHPIVREQLAAELYRLLETRPQAGAAENVPDVVRFWYYDYVLEALVPLARRIHDLKNSSARDLFRVALSATARDTMLTYRGEVRLRKLRPEDQAKFKPDVLACFRKRAELAISRAALIPASPQVQVFQGDCRTIEPATTFHTVVTSPPYGDDKNGVGYFQFSRNMLYFLGFDLAELREQRQKFLGCGSSIVPQSWAPSETLVRTLNLIRQRSDRLHHEALQFYFDYYVALRRLTEITAHRIIIVTGDRTLARTFIDNGHITCEMLEALGWPLEHYYSREIRKKRIANLGTDGGGISLEHILVHRHR